MVEDAMIANWRWGLCLWIGLSWKRRERKREVCRAMTWERKVGWGGGIRRAEESQPLERRDDLMSTELCKLDGSRQILCLQCRSQHFIVYPPSPIHQAGGKSRPAPPGTCWDLKPGK